MLDTYLDIDNLSQVRQKIKKKGGEPPSSATEIATEDEISVHVSANY